MFLNTFLSLVDMTEPSVAELLGLPITAGKTADAAFVNLELNIILDLKLKHLSPNYHTIWVLNLISDERAVPYYWRIQFLPEDGFLE